LKLSVAADQVEREVVDEAEPQPYGIVEADAGDAPRIERAVERAVGRECKGLLAQTARAKTAALARPATLLGGVRGRKLLGHDAECGGRQPGLERAARPSDQERAMAFLDARRRQEVMLSPYDEHQKERREPARGAGCHASGERDQRDEGEKAVGIKIVDRKPDRGDGERDDAELEQDARRSGRPILGHGCRVRSCLVTATITAAFQESDAGCGGNALGARLDSPGKASMIARR